MTANITNENEVSLDFSNTLADMNEWSEQRVSIFASLDAALSKAVVEAATALHELKEQSEDQARQTTTLIISERQRLQRQVEELRLERVRLQDQLTDVRREIEMEQARKLALQRESEALVENARIEQKRVQSEVNRLSRQMENIGQQLQGFFQHRFAELWEQFSQSVAQGEPLPSVPVPSVDQVFGNGFDPMVAWAEPVSAPVETTFSPQDPGLSKTAVTLQDFEDAPTPKANIVPIMPALPVPVAPTSTPDVAPVAATELSNETMLTIEKVVFNQSEIELDESDFLKIFQTTNLPPMVAAGAADSGSPAVATVGKPRQRQVQVRQRVERLLARSHNRAEMVGSQLTKTEARHRRAQRDRQAFASLGAKLGLETEVTTPPSFDQMLFADGFTPPPEVSNFLLRMTTAKNESLAPLDGHSNKSPVLSEAETISLEDIFSQISADLPDDAEFASEIWDEPAPTIGELGPDFAQHWHSTDFPETKNEPPAALLASDAVAPTDIMVSNPKFSNNFPNIPPVPPLKSVSADEQKSSIITTVYVTNLQGLALLTIEKVMRGLPGVYQVVVTTLERGELGMEVRHHPELALDKVLPNLGDFKLKLVEQDQNVLKFIQMR